MAVQSNHTATLTLDGATPAGVEIPVPARGVINRVVISETTSVGGAVSVDIYNQVVSLSGGEAARAPYRVTDRAATTPANAALGGVNGLGLFDKALVYRAGDSSNAAKKVAKSIFVVLTAPGAGARTFSIAMTITDPILI